MRLFLITIAVLLFILVPDTKGQTVSLGSSEVYVADNIFKAKFKGGFAVLRKEIPEKYRKKIEGESFSGGDGINYKYNFDLLNLLSINPQFVYLPTGSYIIFYFEDGLQDFDNSIDVLIESCREPCGCGKHSIDSALISVSTNGRKFIEMGIIKSREVKMLDLSGIGVDSKVHFVKITGLSAQEFPYGFELMNLFGFKKKPIIENHEDNSLIETESKILPISDTILLPRFLFKINSSEINSEHSFALDTIFNWLSNKSVEGILIFGHTDALGTSDYNLGLSMDRANSIRNYLITKGIDNDIIRVDGYGESSLLSGIDSLDYRNRRVEIIVIHKKR